MQFKILKYWKTILATTIICYLSFAQPSTFEKIPKISMEHLDKLIHLILYFGLTLAIFYDQRKNIKKTSTIIRYIAYPIILGGMIEIAQQKWFSPRTGEWLDWLADILGVFLAVILIYIIHKLKPKA